jgi:hypothetical protein
MSLYYFHIKDGETILDDAGTELPNIASAPARGVWNSEPNARRL